MAAQLTKSAWKIIPHFPCTSVARTIDFYTNILHFDLGGRHPDDVDVADATMCSVAIGRKSDANIYLFKTPVGFTPSAAMIALGTEELDEYYALLVREKTVEISMEIEDKEWGYRQFEVRDLDGNRLQFFKFLEGGNPGTE